MEWLEIIKVRVGGTGDRAIDSSCLKLLKKGAKAAALENVRIYANVSISNDLVIILTWRKAIPSPWGSELARRLAQELKQTGLVDYSAWSGTD